MSSGGGGTTTTTQNNDPWAGQAPYLQQVFKTAQNVYGTAYAAGSPMSSLYNTYINNALDPGILTGTSVYPAYQQSLQQINSLTPYAQAIAQNGQQANPWLQQMGDAYGQVAAGTGVAAPLSSAIDAMGNISDQATSNPAVAALFNAAGAQNPYVNAIGASADQQMNNPYISALLGAGGAGNQYIDPLAMSGAAAMANPALAQLNATAQGDYLNPDENPYLTRAVQSALGQAQASIASQFNQGGRYGGGQMQDVQSRALGDIAAQAYTQQYQQERSNQLAAQQALGSQYLQGTGQLSSALQGAGSLQQGQQGLATQAANAAAGYGQQGLASQLAGYGSAANALANQQGLSQQALNAAGQQYSTGVGQNLQAWQNVGTMGNQQVQNLMNMLGLNTSATEAQMNRQMTGQQEAANTLLQAGQNQNQAVGLSPYVQGLQTQYLQNIQNAANTQQWQLTQPVNNLWNNLNQYASIVGGNNWGSSGTQETPYYNNTAGQVAGGVMGAGALALGMAALMSSRSQKIPTGAPDVEALIEGLRAMPIDLWRYISLDHGLHVGPYAEDFKAHFGFGDGNTIPVVDALGVLFVIVKWLLERVR